MSNYKKPVVMVVDDLAEGIYASSGSSGHGCKSLYMNGVFVVGTQSPINDGYKVGKGCEGCPAGGSRCRVHEVNYDGDFRPSWEVSGKLPDEKGY